jgi:hypothetical protein
MESVDVALSETVGFTCDRLHFLKRTLCFFPTLGFWRYHNFHAKHTVYLQLGWYVGELVYHLKMLVFETLQRNSCQVFPGQIMVV